MKRNKFLSDIKHTCLNLNFTIEMFSEEEIKKVLDKNKNNLIIIISMKEIFFINICKI